MTDENLEMVVAVFSMEWKAKRALERLQQRAEEPSFELVDGAIMVKDAAGELTISETLGPTPEKGAKRGALIGGVIGAIFPPGILAAAAIGAATGTAVGHFRKLGLADDYLDRLDEELAAGRVALLVVIDEADAETAVGGLDDYLRLERHHVR